jgi:hypothetical protein
MRLQSGGRCGRLEVGAESRLLHVEVRLVVTTRTIVHVRNTPFWVVSLSVWLLVESDVDMVDRVLASDMRREGRRWYDDDDEGNEYEASEEGDEGS